MRKVSLWVQATCAVLLVVVAACATAPDPGFDTESTNPDGPDSGMPPCTSSGCAPCAEGRTSCGGSCVDLKTDVAHCGGCGTDCHALGSRADSCVEGKCACRGTTAGACSVGQQCTPQGCVALACGAEGCPAGCCDATKSCLPSGPTHCGSGGASCVDCATLGSRVDGCQNGQCGCAGNGGAACASGLVCTPKGCAPCDQATCPSGCCGAGGCKTLAAASCGPPGGGACADCAVLHGDGADSCNAGGSCGCGTATPCATGFACAGGVCILRCAVGDTFVLPATYEKWCDQTLASCTVLTAPTDRFLSTPTGTYSGYAVFDTGVLPAGRTIKDAVFMLFSGGGGNFGGSYIGAPTSNPASGTNSNPAMDGSTSLGRLFAGSSLFQTAYFGLPPVASGAAVWVRAGQEHATATTTLRDLVTGWKTGSLPNYGLSFILDIGQATSSKGKPPLTLAVCLDP